MKHLRVKSAMRPGAADCLCRAGADCLESSQKLKGGRAARAAEGEMNPRAEGSARGWGAVDAIPGRAARDGQGIPGAPMD